MTENKLETSAKTPTSRHSMPVTWQTQPAWLLLKKFKASPEEKDKDVDRSDSVGRPIGMVGEALWEGYAWNPQQQSHSPVIIGARVNTFARRLMVLERERAQRPVALPVKRKKGSSQALGGYL